MSPARAHPGGVGRVLMVDAAVREAGAPAVVLPQLVALRRAVVQHLCAPCSHGRAPEGTLKGVCGAAWRVPSPGSTCALQVLMSFIPRYLEEDCGAV